MERAGILRPRTDSLELRFTHRASDGTFLTHDPLRAMPGADHGSEGSHWVRGTLADGVRIRGLLRHVRAQRCLKARPRRDEFVVYYNRLVEVSAPGKVSRLAVTAEGDVVHELDQWRDGI